MSIWQSRFRFKRNICISATRCICLRHPIIGRKMQGIKHINTIKMRNKNEKMQDWMQEVFHTESNSQLWITLWISVNKPEKSEASWNEIVDNFEG